MAMVLRLLSILAVARLAICLVDDVPACAKVGIAFNDPKRNSTPNGNFTNSAAVCQMNCKYLEFCQFFTWYSNTGGCWLQGTRSELVEISHSVSGAKICEEECASSFTGCWLAGLSWFHWALFAVLALAVAYCTYSLCLYSFQRCYDFGASDRCLIWPASAERSGEEIYLSRGFSGPAMGLTREPAWWKIVSASGYFGGLSGHIRLESFDSTGLYMTVRKKGSSSDTCSRRGMEGMLDCVNPVPTPDDIIALTDSKGIDSLFRLVPALNRNRKMRSFESMKNPGCYVCHFDGQLFCHDPDDMLSAVGLTVEDEMSWVVHRADHRTDDPVARFGNLQGREDTRESELPLFSFGDRDFSH